MFPDFLQNNPINPSIPLILQVASVDGHRDKADGDDPCDTTVSSCAHLSISGPRPHLHFHTITATDKHNYISTSELKYNAHCALDQQISKMRHTRPRKFHVSDLLQVRSVVQYSMSTVWILQNKNKFPSIQNIKDQSVTIRPFAAARVVLRMRRGKKRGQIGTSCSCSCCTGCNAVTYYLIIIQLIAQAQYLINA